MNAESYRRGLGPEGRSSPRRARVFTRTRVDRERRPGLSIVAVVRQGGVEGAIRDLGKLLGQLTEELRGVRIARVGVRSHWISEVTSDWEGVLQQYRRAFFAPNAPLGEVGDLSVIVEPPKWPVNGMRVQHGPMKQPQLLAQYLPFPERREHTPELMFFADIDVATDVLPPARDRLACRLPLDWRLRSCAGCAPTTSP